MRYASGKYALAICDRCSQRYAYDDLRPDGESPALRVCEDCYDRPVRYRTREPDAVSIRHARPDVTFDVPPAPQDRIPFPPGQVPPSDEEGEAPQEPGLDVLDFDADDWDEGAWE